MKWIHSPSWDLCWILSAPLLGVGAVFFPPLLGGALALRFAHIMAPVALAWGHRGFRPIMLAQPRKFIGIPAVLLLLALVVAWLNIHLYPGFGPHWTAYPNFAPGHVELEYASWFKLGLPIIVLLNISAVWDLYHSAAQDFGLWCLFRRRGVQGWRKWMVLGVFLGTVIFLSHIIFYFFPLMVLSIFLSGMLRINHFLAEIGLTSHVHGQHWNVSPWWFAATMLLFGFAAASLYRCVQHLSPAVDTLAVALYAWLGIWHFLQDRWIWRMSDPQVRATIGRDLFT